MKKIILLLLVCCKLLTNSFGQCGADPLSGTTTISTASQIVNGYFPGSGNPLVGNTTLTVGAIDSRGNTTALTAGDLVLIIQMQGADIDAANTNSYGDGVAGGVASGYQNNVNLVSGYYEYNTVTGFSAGTITFTYSLANNYYTRAFSAGVGSRAYQVIRVPRNYNLDITSTGSVTAPEWNGTTGGIVVLDAANIITLNGSVVVSAKGFRGGGGKNFDGASAGNTNGSTTLVNTDYRWNSPVTTAANTTGGAKGEGIAGTPVYTLVSGATTTNTNLLEGYVDGSLGRGAPGNAGGGSTDGVPVGPAQNGNNTGGGGGGNAGAGGNGGSGWHGGAGNVSTYPFGGFGGSPFLQASISKLIMGGGGGAGTANNSTAANEYQSSGGAGGGIVIMRGKSYAGTGSVNANGGDAPGVVGVGGTANTDAAGGGGAGGSIVLVISQNGASGLSGINVSATGGKGGDMTNYYDHGPGGGGGGGIIYANGVTATAVLTGGANGKTRTGSAGGPVTNDFGATAGANGTLLTLVNAPVLINKNNIASPCGTLPVNLLQFYTAVKQNGVALYWLVDNAVNFNHFEIEYSLTGTDFFRAGKIDYINGRNQYDFLHQTTAGFIYYRLKMVDINGAFAYSKILTVRLNRGNAAKALVYPNPATTNTVLQLNCKNSALAFLMITDESGKVLDKKTVTLQNGDMVIPVNLEKFSSGFYILLVEVNNEIIVREKIQKINK